VVIVGLLILLVVAVIVIATVARGGDPTSIDLGAFVIRTSFTGVFVAGALTLLLGLLGVMVLLSGLRRSRRRRAEVHELRDRAGAKGRSEGGSRKSAPEQATSATRASQGPPPAAGTEEPRRQPRDADESFDSAPRDH
jgi:hypothetical protein